MIHEHRVLIPGPVGQMARKLEFQRPLWAFLQEGGQQALRLLVEGRSIATGQAPKWLKDATAVEFLGYGNQQGELIFQAPAIAEVLEWKEHQSLFPAPFTPEDSALTLLERCLEDALSLQRDSDALDDALLKGLTGHLRPLLKEAGTLEMKNGRSIRIGNEALSAFSQLRRETPAKQWCRVTGKLEAIFHSSHAFALQLSDGHLVRGVVEEGLIHELKQHWGKRVRMEGQAVFRASGNVQRIEAHHIEVAEEGEEIWSAMPQPLFPEFHAQELHQAQGAKSGLAAIIGQWPGDETDDQIRAALQALA